MRLVIVLLTLASCLLLPPRASAAGKRPQEGSITFHVEGTGSDHPKMVFRVPESQKVFQRLASITNDDIAAFQAFPSEDGNYGAVFHLRKRGANRLYALSTAARGNISSPRSTGAPSMWC